MAKERLSKLQKWILVEAYKKGKRNYESGFRESYYLSRQEVYKGYWADYYFELSPPKKWSGSPIIKIAPDDYNSGCIVVLCNCLKNLKKKGLAEMHGKSFSSWRKDYIVLTDKGIEMAKKLMGQEINIKDSKDWKLRHIMGLAPWYLEEELKGVLKSLNINTIESSL